MGPAQELGAFAELKLEEIKNGRLALVSRSGLVVWAPVTCQGPIKNWAQHIADMFTRMLGAVSPTVSLHLIVG